jgi:phage terminase Nu1 subunit (DNA packaging protein)
LSETIVDSLEAVAAHFRKSVRQVRNWRREGMPCLSGERFDLVQIEEWRARKKGGRGPAAPDERQGILRVEDKDFWDKEGKRYQAELRKLEYRQRLGELVERQEVEQLFIARILAVKQGLLNLSRGLPPQLIHCQEEREMEVIITQKIRELLDEFSRPLPGNLGAGVKSPALNLKTDGQN